MAVKRSWHCAGLWNARESRIFWRTVLLYYSGHGILTKGRKLFLATGHSSFDLPQNVEPVGVRPEGELSGGVAGAILFPGKCNVAVAVVALVLLVFAAFGPRLLSLIHTLLATAHEPSATEITIHRAVQEARAAAESGKTGVEFQECDVCPQMVAIPAGSFAMAPGWNGAGGTYPSHVQFLGPSL